MNLYNLDLGDREYEEKEILDLDNTVTVNGEAISGSTEAPIAAGKVLFYEIGVVFRAKAGFGPSTLDIVIPYGAPAYRVSERPLCGLALHTLYSTASTAARNARSIKFAEQTGLQEVFECLGKKYTAFAKAGMLVGQRMQSEASPTDRDCIIVNDCIHLEQEKTQSRVALVDLFFRSTSKSSHVCTEELEQFVSNLAGRSKNLSFVSVECREYDQNQLLSKSSIQNIHVYLLMNLENGFHSVRQEWLSYCHDLYYQRFMQSSEDIIKDENLMLTCIDGGLYVVGEYNWTKQLKEVVPHHNTAYEVACEDFRRSKAAVKRIKDLGECPDFVRRMRAKTDKTPDQPTEADVKEARAMGW